MSKKRLDSDSEDVTSMEQLQGIRRLNNDRVNLHEQRPKIRHVIRPQIESETSPHQYQSGDFAAHSSVSDSWFHSGLQKKLQRRIRMGQLPIVDSLDLHGMKQQQALPALSDFLFAMMQSHARLVIIIHGQGYRSRQQPVLKPLVQRWLGDQPEVLAWCPAQPQHGGAGATYVYLRQGVER